MTAPTIPGRIRATQISQKVRFEVLQRDGFACVYCGAQAGPQTTLEVDHRVPRVEGGPNDMDNYATACRSCNGGKGGRSAKIAPLRRFSHSLVDTYLDCPKKAMYRYVDEVPSPKTTALVKGSATDEVWNDALILKMNAQPLSPTEIVERTEQVFRRIVHEEGGPSAVSWGEGEEPKKAARTALGSAMTLSRVWATQLLPDIEPTAVQVELTKALPSGRTFIGFLDYEGIVEGVPGVGDNKTGSRRMAKSDAAKALQPSAYAWLRGEPTSFVFSRAIDTGANSYSEFVWTGRSAGDNAWYGQLVEDVERGFVAGTFPPNPKSNLCGAKWCPFFERCQPHRTVHGNALPSADLADADLADADLAEGSVAPETSESEKIDAH
jgi:hypothetical protein